MFSNIFHLFCLLQESKAFDPIEKNKIYKYNQRHPNKTLATIRILENEQKGLAYIRNQYISQMGPILKEYNYIFHPEQKKFQDIKEKMRKIHLQEAQEKAVELQNLYV
ncbi:hypothetical protein KGV55_02755 [Candidatus Gracilibacteria bacterium]|nr:hypothetical protein [Candidatus Gracilibacteria bacterium]